MTAPGSGAAGWSTLRELVRVAPEGSVPVAAEVEVARSWWRRAVGWIGRAAVPDQAALWLPGTRSIHTAGLRTAIDLVFLDLTGRVVALYECLSPWRAVLGPATAVVAVELAPGRIARAGLRVGDRLALRSRPAGPGDVDA